MVGVGAALADNGGGAALDETGGGAAAKESALLGADGEDPDDEKSAGERVLASVAGLSAGPEKVSRSANMSSKLNPAALGDVDIGADAMFLGTADAGGGAKVGPSPPRRGLRPKVVEVCNASAREVSSSVAYRFTLTVADRTGSPSELLLASRLTGGAREDSGGGAAAAPLKADDSSAERFVLCDRLYETFSIRLPRSRSGSRKSFPSDGRRR